MLIKTKEVTRNYKKAEEMRNSLSKSFLIAALSGIFFLTSCHDTDYFDYANIAKDYADNWVKKYGEIDPEQDWNSAMRVTANLSIKEDALAEYTFKIYTHNPLYDDNAKLLAKQTVNTDANGFAAATIQIDIQKGSTILWVSRIDSHHRRLVKPVDVVNSVADCAFGISAPSQANAKTRVGADDGITKMAAPYTTAQIEAFLKGATELVDGTALDDSNTNKSPLDGRVYKVTKNFTGTYTHSGAEGLNGAKIKLIVWGEGAKLNLIDITNAGLEIIVGNGGEIVAPQTENGCVFTVNNNGTPNHSKLTVLGGGKVSGGKINFSCGGENYNAGTITLETLSNNGGTFYNCGTMNVKLVEGRAGNSKFINNGKFEADNVVGANVNFETGCLFKVNEKLEALYFKVGKNASIETYDMSLLHSGQLELMPTSLVKVTNKLWLNNNKILGPTISTAGNFSDYGMMKIHTIKQWDFTPNVNGYIAGHVVMDVNEFSDDNAKWCYENGGVANGYTPQNLIATKHVVCTTLNESPITISTDDCTGDGYTPTEEGGDNDTDDTPISWIIACEDLGSTHDFDFNDIVFRVSHVSGETKATVTPLAAGGKLSAYIKFVNGNETQDIGEIHDLFGSQFSNNGHLMVNTNAYMDNEDLHKYTDGVEANSIEINVPSDYTLSYDPNTSTNMGGFAIQVQSSENNATTIISSQTGESPQMILVPGDWIWPREYESIEDVYEDFGAWSKNMNINTNWYNTNINSNLLYKK